MRRIFLSHSFQDRDRDLVDDVEAMIRSHGLVATNGRALGGGPLTTEIQRVIEEADALVALLTRRHDDPQNITHPWVRDELLHARSIKRPTIGMFELTVPADGSLQDQERIEYDPQAPLPAFMKLSTILGEWKRRAGRRFKVRVLPEDVERAMRPRWEQIQCEFRFIIDGRDSEWTKATLRPEVGGVFVEFRIPDEVEMIQLRASGLGSMWGTDYTPLWTPANFATR